MAAAAQYTILTHMQKENKTVLIIEDEQSLLGALKEKFTSEGFSVLTAENGEQGLAEAIKHEPDIILLDIILPKMDGLSMLNKLRHDGWAKDTPVFILTNVDDREKMATAVDNMVQGYFIKSDQKLEDIVAAVRQKLNSKNQ